MQLNQKLLYCQLNYSSYVFSAISSCVLAELQLNQLLPERLFYRLKSRIVKELSTDHGDVDKYDMFYRAKRAILKGAGIPNYIRRRVLTEAQGMCR